MLKYLDSSLSKYIKFNWNQFKNLQIYFNTRKNPVNHF